MKIIIVGGGKVGTTIVEQLISEGHNITVVDLNSDVVNNITNNFDVMGVIGNGTSHLVQIDAGIETADLLIAVTDSDEQNLLCCLFAKKVGNCRTIARVRNPAYNNEINFIKEELGISMIINPELAAATEISRILKFPSAIKIETFAKGKIELLEFKITDNSILNNKSLIEIGRLFGLDVLVCAVERADEVIIPNGSFVLKENDTISIVGSLENIKKFFKKINLYTNQVLNTIIVGGGKISYYLALQLVNMGIDVKIIEQDIKKCEYLSELLPKVEIINGDASNQDLLEEEGVLSCGSFVSLTGMDEENIFLSLFVKNKTKAKVVTKINKISFDDIVSTFNLGSIIYPKYITAEYIISYVRALQNGIGSNVETLYKIINKKAEALEFKIKDHCNLIGKSLEEINLKDNLLIASINRNGKVIVPNGKSSFKVGDTVVVVTTRTGLNDFKDILKD